MTATIHPTRSRARWVAFTRPTGRTIALALLASLLLVGGAMVAWVMYTRDSQQLTQALKHVESGAIENEPEGYKAQVALDLTQPMAQLLPGVYSNLTRYDSVIYNAVLLLKTDGTYDYALTVGNERVHKRYGHRGRWWVQGKVFHTVLLDGDFFLTAPEARNRATAARERIVSSSADQLTLQAHYGPAVTFIKVQ